MLYQVDISVDDDHGNLQIISVEGSEFEKCITETEEYLERHQNWNPQILAARQILNLEVIDIKYKIIELINRRK